MNIIKKVHLIYFLRFDNSKMKISSPFQLSFARYILVYKSTSIAAFYVEEYKCQKHIDGHG